MKSITSLQNPLVKHLVKLRIDRSYREKAGSVLISGEKLVKELQHFVDPIDIFTDTPSPHTHVTTEIMKKITGLPNPEGIAAEFPLPRQDPLNQLAPLLALDQIRDPGNLGTLIRTAWALGWKGIFFLPGCVDPFHEKVIRASRGALFHLPWRQGSWEELKQFPLKRFNADIKGSPLHTISPQKEIVFLLSNEGQGVSEEGSRFGESITIPMEKGVDSLNVSIAGAIMMYYLARDD